MGFVKRGEKFFPSSGIRSVSFFTSRQNRSWWNTAGMLRVLCFPPRPPFVSINHGPGGVPPRMGRCSCTHCHASCTRARNSSSSSSSSFSSSSLLFHPRPLKILPPPASSRPPRLRPFSFKCFFMWFRRFVSTCIFFSFRLAQRRPRSLSSRLLSPLLASPSPPLPLKRAPLLLGSPA